MVKRMVVEILELQAIGGQNNIYTWASDLVGFLQSLYFGFAKKICTSYYALYTNCLR
jgi:hypothetical protein